MARKLDWEKANRRGLSRREAAQLKHAAPTREVAETRDIVAEHNARITQRPITGGQIGFFVEHLPGTPIPDTFAEADRVIDETITGWKAKGWTPRT